MSANDLDDDLESELVYDTQGRKINNEFGDKIEYEVVDDDFRPEKDRVFRRIKGEEYTAMIQLAPHMPPHYMRRLKGFMMRGKTLEEAQELLRFKLS